MSAALLALAVAAAGAGASGPALPAPPRAAAGTPAAPSSDRDRIVQLRFAWTSPLRARVTYRRTRVGPSGRTAFTARYEQRVEPDGAGLRIETRGTTWTGDLPFPSSLARDAVRASEAVVQRVGAGGEFAGLDGVEAMQPVLARAFEEARVPPDAAERAIARALAAMRAEAEEAWNLAVGFWTGADLALGETYALETEADVPLLPGVRAEHAVEFQVRRRVPCAATERAPRCVEATLRAVPDRGAVERAAGALLARLLPADEERPAGAPGELSVESELVLVTEPETLLPRRLVWTKAVRLGAPEDGPARAERVDRSEWDYRYAAPEPPRRPGRRGAPAANAAPPSSPRAPHGRGRGRSPRRGSAAHGRRSDPRGR